MKNWICEIFGHKWRKGWAGGLSGVFGAIVVNYKDCERCGKHESEYTTKIDIQEEPEWIKNRY